MRIDKHHTSAEKAQHRVRALRQAFAGGMFVPAVIEASTGSNLEVRKPVPGGETVRPAADRLEI
jgi:hypothetical protein